MGSYKEILKGTGCSGWLLCSLMASAAGGAMLVWWRLRFHPSNAQLWMVPLGLILFGTPVLTWVSIFVSSKLCYSNGDSSSFKTQTHVAAKQSGPTVTRELGDSVVGYDPESHKEDDHH